MLWTVTEKAGKLKRIESYDGLWRGKLAVHQQSRR